MSETGIGLSNPLFFIGCVENIGAGTQGDLRHEGRVQVRAFNIHGSKDEIPTEFLPWATVVYGNYDPNVRLGLNDWVFGMFMDGREAQQPMVLGLIPTGMMSAPDPENEGFGVVPSEDCDVQLGANGADGVGNPRNDNLFRRENINDTYVPALDAMRTEDIEGAEGSETWSEPPPAYDAKYPYNRVIKTAKHSIEIDDTPNAERIMIHHNSGSYIQIDDSGNQVNKSIGDDTSVNDRNQYIYVHGTSNVTINGNAFVKVNGNKTEEVNGNLTQLVHGNYHLSVGGEANINASELLNLRANDFLAEALAGEMHLRSQNNLLIGAGEGSGGIDPYGVVSISGEKLNLESRDKLSISAFTQLNLQSPAEINVGTKDLRFQSTEFNSLSGSHYLTSTLESNFSALNSKLTGTATNHIKGASVFIDDVISMANGGAATADSNLAAMGVYFAVPAMANIVPYIALSPNAESAEHAQKVADLPPPVDKRMSVAPTTFTHQFEGGILAVDDVDPAPAVQDDLYIVGKGSYSNGTEYFMIQDTRTGIRAQPESGVATLYTGQDAEENANKIAARLNAGGTGFE